MAVPSTLTDITFVIQGKEFHVDVGVKDPVDEDISKALDAAGVAGGTGGWTARTESGEALDGAKTLEEQGVTGPGKILLNKGPGRGG